MNLANFADLDLKFLVVGSVNRVLADHRARRPLLVWDEALKGDNDASCVSIRRF